MVEHPNDQRSKDDRASAPAGADAPQFNADAYLPAAADWDLDEDQARALLETLWSIMRSFVELGFDGDGLGTIAPTIFRSIASDQDNLISSENISSDNRGSANGKDG